ncbi:MAG: HlyD family efflux transporter periplasmic adaptor subunit [Bacteroidota bacterium]
MLNISKTNNSIIGVVPTKDLECFQRNELPQANRMFAFWLVGLLVLILLIFFLPWTQNIQMNGKVTTLLPGQRPQDVNSTIGGRIENWYVREGDLVEAGDTLVFLSEVKTEYFDANQLARTGNQIEAKRGSRDSYQQKANALNDQIIALQQELTFKREQLNNKIQQVEFKIETQKATIQQAELDESIAAFQYRRTDTLFRKGIKSLSDLEGKRLKMQETQAKLVKARNKLQEANNELSIAKIAFQNVDNEYNNKIAKARSDKFATLSTVFEAEGSINKLETKLENLYQRNKMYHVIAPQTGYITKTIKSGIGEIIKEGDKILTIVPYERELAVEMYVRPMDLPLMNIGQEVRLVFDGWQAFIISGWADFSFGTYSGEVVAIDNVPNENNKYRILVKSNQEETPFPQILRVGAGAQGIALLQDVPVWYEIWRQLNGFPADFYRNDIEKNKSGFKPPVKSVAK